MKKILSKILIIILCLCLLALLVIKFYEPFGDSYSNDKARLYAQRNKFYYKGTFHDKTPISVMNDQKSTFSKNEKTVPTDDVPIHTLTSIPRTQEMTWTWFGHSSSLLQMNGLNIMIDPIWSEYSSPLQGVGTKRFSKLPISIKKLPKIDILLISHDHYDHLDYETIRQLDNKVKVYCVPLGVENHLIRWGVNKKKIHIMSWWEEINIEGLNITCTPGRHYTGRLPWKNNTTLWCGYLLKNKEYKTYYTGDTGYSDYFKEIYKRYGSIDFLIIENGQYDVSWESIHLLPTQTIKAIKQLHAKWTVPVHWGTFSLAYHAWDDPIKQITSLSFKHQIQLATPMMGEIVHYKEIEKYRKNWWKSVK